MALWFITCPLLFSWTPKPLHHWRSLLLRLFGARIDGVAFVASSAKITMPWNLTLANRACIGADVRVYNLGPISIGKRATVAQESYLCGGTHDFDNPNLPLIIGPIVIGDDAFIGARSFISPGVTIGPGAIIGACSVVTKDVPASTVSAGNPSKIIRERNPRNIDLC
jgi:putative colanic acid biosynthesis acetyltransferase WcaF